MSQSDPDLERGLAAGALARALGESVFDAACRAVAVAFDEQAASRSRLRRLRERTERWRLLALRHRAMGDLAMARAYEAAANELELSQ